MQGRIGKNWPASGSSKISMTLPCRFWTTSFRICDADMAVSCRQKYWKTNKRWKHADHRNRFPFSPAVLGSQLVTPAPHMIHPQYFWGEGFKRQWGLRGQQSCSNILVLFTEGRFPMIWQCHLPWRVASWWTTPMSLAPIWATKAIHLQFSWSHVPASMSSCSACTKQFIRDVLHMQCVKVKETSSPETSWITSSHTRKIQPMYGWDTAAVTWGHTLAATPCPLVDPRPELWRESRKGCCYERAGKVLPLPPV